MSRPRDKNYIVKTFRNNRHFEHDDRSPHGNQHRQNQYKSFSRSRYHHNAVLDEDAPMSSVSKRFETMDRMKGRGRGRFNRRGVGVLNRHPSSANNQFSWFQIQIPYGRNYGKDFIIKALKENIPEAFYPIWYAEDSRTRDSSFFVEGQQSSDSLMALDQRIDTPNGYKMKLISRRTSPPMMDVDDSVKEQIKLTLSNRYRADNRTLDLSSFSKDTSLLENGLFLPLYRQPVVTAVLDIISANIPDVIGINLSGNRLNNLNLFKSLSTTCPNLIGLNLSKNWIPSVGLLDAISGLPLVELSLDGNKLCNSFKTKAEYVSAVRKRFPKVVLLDNVELPPPVQFSLDDSDCDKKMPQPCRTYFCSQSNDIVLLFLKQYFDVFDSHKRQDLIHAYHETCHFSSSVAASKHLPADKFVGWYASSRNVLRVSLERASGLLSSGRQSVIDTITSLPSTQHDTNSFTLDMSLANDRLIQVVVTGVFRERDEKHQPVRAFTRSFVMVPFGSGLCIVNDMLQIQQPTPEQIKNSFKAMAPTPSPSPVPQVAPACVMSVGVASAVQSREDVIRSFCQLSGMNVEWSTRCLEENGFNVELSAQVFSRLKMEGKIPDAAFVHTS